MGAFWMSSGGLSSIGGGIQKFKRRNFGLFHHICSDCESSFLGGTAAVCWSNPSNLSKNLVLGIGTAQIRRFNPSNDYLVYNLKPPCQFDFGPEFN